MRKIITLTILTLALYTLTAAATFNWYSQSDSRWDSARLGNSGSSIGSSGCVLSCLSMLLNAEASNPNITPDRLNDWLRKNGGYIGDLMRWQIAGEIDGNGLGLELQSQTEKNNDWDYLSGELDKGNKVIVKVKGRRSHWVLVVGREGPIDKASSYIINDPGMDSFQKRTLAYFGGYTAARSYSGNWLDEQAFSLNSQINVVPVDKDETFLYELSKQPVPADVFVTLENKLKVGITGYYMLGLFDQNGNLVRTVDYEYAAIGPEEKLDLIYEMADITLLRDQGHDLRIIYSKHFSSVPIMNETLALPSPGLLNNTIPAQN